MPPKEQPIAKIRKDIEKHKKKIDEKKDVKKTGKRVVERKTVLDLDAKTAKNRLELFKSISEEPESVALKKISEYIKKNPRDKRFNFYINNLNISILRAITYDAYDPNSILNSIAKYLDDNNIKIETDKQEKKRELFLTRLDYITELLGVSDMEKRVIDDISSPGSDKQFLYALLTIIKGGDISILKKIETSGKIRDALVYIENTIIHNEKLGNIYIQFTPDNMFIYDKVLQRLTSKTTRKYTVAELLKYDIVSLREIVEEESLDVAIPNYKTLDNKTNLAMSIYNNLPDLAYTVYDTQEEEGDEGDEEDKEEEHDYDEDKDESDEEDKEEEHDYDEDKDEEQVKPQKLRDKLKVKKRKIDSLTQIEEKEVDGIIADRVKKTKKDGEKQKPEKRVYVYKPLVNELPVVKFEVKPPFYKQDYISDKVCYSEQQTKKWIPEYDSTWITSNDDFKQYVFTETSVEYNGKIYYKTNKKFDLLKCSIYSNKNTYNTLHVSETGRITIDTIYLLKNGEYIPHTPEIYTKEREYIRFHKADFLQKLDLLLESTQYSYPVLKTVLMDHLQSISSVDSKYSESVIDTCITESKKMREAIMNYAEIAVFLDPNLAGKYSDVFAKRFSKMIYSPSAIIYLSETDKIPQLQTIDTRIDTRILDSCKEFKKYLVYSLARAYYSKLTNSFYKMPYSARAPMLQGIALDTVSSACKNSVENYEDWEILYYKEDGNIWCFSIYQIPTLLSDKLNPHTGRLLSSDFLEQISKLYNTESLTKSSEISQEQSAKILEQLREENIDKLMKIVNDFYLFDLLPEDIDPQTGNISTLEKKVYQLEPEPVSMPEKELNDNFDEFASRVIDEGVALYCKNAFMQKILDMGYESYLVEFLKLLQQDRVKGYTIHTYSSIRDENLRSKIRLEFNSILINLLLYAMLRDMTNPQNDLIKSCGIRLVDGAARKCIFSNLNLTPTTSISTLFSQVVQQYIPLYKILSNTSVLDDRYPVELEVYLSENLKNIDNEDMVQQLMSGYNLTDITLFNFDINLNRIRHLLECKQDIIAMCNPYYNSPPLVNRLNGVCMINSQGDSKSFVVDSKLAVLKADMQKGKSQQLINTNKNLWKVGFIELLGSCTSIQKCFANLVRGISDTRRKYIEKIIQQQYSSEAESRLMCNIEIENSIFDFLTQHGMVSKDISPPVHENRDYIEYTINQTLLLNSCLRLELDEIEEQMSILKTLNSCMESKTVSKRRIDVLKDTHQDIVSTVKDLYFKNMVYNRPHKSANKIISVAMNQEHMDSVKGGMQDVKVKDVSLSDNRDCYDTIINILNTYDKNIADIHAKIPKNNIYNILAKTNYTILISLLIALKNEYENRGMSYDINSELYKFLVAHDRVKSAFSKSDDNHRRLLKSLSTFNIIEDYTVVREYIKSFKNINPDFSKILLAVLDLKGVVELKYMCYAASLDTEHILVRLFYYYECLVYQTYGYYEYKTMVDRRLLLSFKNNVSHNKITKLGIYSSNKEHVRLVNKLLREDEYVVEDIFKDIPEDIQTNTIVRYLEQEVDNKYTERINNVAEKIYQLRDYLREKKVGHVLETIHSIKFLDIYIGEAVEKIPHDTLYRILEDTDMRDLDIKKIEYIFNITSSYDKISLLKSGLENVMNYAAKKSMFTTDYDFPTDVERVLRNVLSLSLDDLYTQMYSISITTAADRPVREMASLVLSHILNPDIKHMIYNKTVPEVIELLRNTPEEKKTNDEYYDKAFTEISSVNISILEKEDIEISSSNTQDTNEYILLVKQIRDILGHEFIQMLVTTNIELKNLYDTVNILKSRAKILLDRYTTNLDYTLLNNIRLKQYGAVYDSMVAMMLLQPSTFVYVSNYIPRGDEIFKFLPAGRAVIYGDMIRLCDRFNSMMRLDMEDIPRISNSMRQELVVKIKSPEHVRRETTKYYLQTRDTKLVELLCNRSVEQIVSAAREYGIDDADIDVYSHFRTHRVNTKNQDIEKISRADCLADIVSEKCSQQLFENILSPLINSPDIFICYEKIRNIVDTVNRIQQFRGKCCISAIPDRYRIIKSVLSHRDLSEYVIVNESRHDTLLSNAMLKILIRSGPEYLNMILSKITEDMDPVDSLEDILHAILVKHRLNSDETKRIRYLRKKYIDNYSRIKSLQDRFLYEGEVDTIIDQINQVFSQQDAIKSEIEKVSKNILSHEDNLYQRFKSAIKEALVPYSVPEEKDRDSELQQFISAINTMIVGLETSFLESDRVDIVKRCDYCRRVIARNPTYYSENTKKFCEKCQ